MSVIRKTPAQVVSLINDLLESANRQQIAGRINEPGHRIGAANPSPEECHALG
ncbi:hypothetical protein [Sinorhizobium americanum]|uniref:Uncharacterized protein n=1 Tax=Sinorhizobium americanum TaxID=194963 RepID=A0A1L3LTK3_9HYPH|nr:hypothetical protein [Sinorhizobium americanum]APG93386.1 hypothetical protein SAMCFNEI73_pB0188 [Sinorhizobium americanum]